MTPVVDQPGLMKVGAMTAFSGEECEIRRVSLKDFPISADVLYLLPERIVKKYQVLPVAHSGNHLTMAVAKPVNLHILKMIRRATRLRIHPLFCARKEIQDAIQYFYAPAPIVRKTSKMKSPVTKPKVTSTPVDHALAEKWFVQLLLQAIEKKCNQIILESTLSRTKIYFKMLTRQEEQDLPADLPGGNVVRYLKLLADRSDSRQSFWEQQIRLDFNASPLSIYLSGICSAGNSIITIKIHYYGEITSLQKLGLISNQIDLLEKILQQKTGVLFISAAAENGKTTTVNTLTNYLLKKQRRIIQLCQSIEIPNDGVVQIALQTWNSIDSNQFWTLIKQQKPCVLLIDDFYSRDVLKPILELAAEDILIIFTMPFQEVHQLAHFFQTQKINLLAKQNYYLIRQFLVHQLCDHCKETVVPDSENPFQPVFQAGNGCPHCQHTGFQGISGIFEINTLNQKVIYSQHYPDYFTGIIDGQPTLFEAGMQKVEQGEIGLEAIMQRR